MELEIGTEERFLEFVSKSKGKKIALISHTDLDGITSAKIANEIFHADIFKFVEYTDLNIKLAEELKNLGVERIVFTDINVQDEKFVAVLESFAEVLIIDHHKTSDLNSEKTFLIKGENGYSAGYLCYELFSKIKNLEKFDWLVACSCISDYCHIKSEKWLNEIMKKYADSLEHVDGYVRKGGEFWELQKTLSMALIYFKDNPKKVYDSIGENFGEIGDLEKHAQEVQSEIDNAIKNFENEREEFEEGWFYEFDSKFGINSIVSTILSSSEKDKAFVLISPYKNLYKISIRRQDKNFDCDKFVKKLMEGFEGAGGGGHVPAAGGYFMKGDLEEFKKKLGIKTFK
ncbi:MAG: hypothetical protein KJ905_01500 [Nanoarchaeota archaeon]|nr:hypothetical protein [Nanoarchaeota archaeon]MBU1501435.1 hypothetical protein [Nanoarchaeota archaeon]